MPVRSQSKVSEVYNMHICICDFLLIINDKNYIEAQKIWLFVSIQQ